MRKPTVANTNNNKKDSHHRRTRSEITNSLLQQAQRKASKFERPPFDPNATISYFEEETCRVTPRRNYRGVLAENPANYFDFPIPNWVKANENNNQKQNPTPLPRGITSTLAQVHKSHLGNGSGAENNAPPPVFPDLQVVTATGAPSSASYLGDQPNVSVINRSNEPEFSFQVARETREHERQRDEREKQHQLQQQQQDSTRALNFSGVGGAITNSTSLSSSALFSNLLTFNMSLLLECESRERHLLSEQAGEFFVSSIVVEKHNELKRKVLDTSQQRNATIRRQYDQALETLVKNRLELIGDASHQMCGILWEEFDLTNDCSLISSLLKMNNNSSNEDNDEGSMKHGSKAENRKPANKDETAHQTDIETRLAELETLLSWNKFERRRLEDLLRQETADAAAAKASRDAAMQQLAALESECVPLLQGMKEIFGPDGQSPIRDGGDGHQQQSNNNSYLLGSFLGSAKKDNEHEHETTREKTMRTALERVADQIEQSPLHNNNKSHTSNNSHQYSSDQREDFQKLPSKEVLGSLDRETLASMILLERQLSNRMLIGAKSQVFAEVEAQRRFVDTNILLKKQAAHSMFLADLFQHRLPQLRRACNALGNVIHKFENASSSSSSTSLLASSSTLRHKSNVVSRHNPGSAVATAGVNHHHSTQPVLTHSALVAYSKSLVAHVSSMLRWLDTEAG